ncbi:MAG: hypothetical protein ACLR95_04345 [Enterococcus avium]
MNAFTYQIDDHLAFAFPQLEAAEELLALIESDRSHIEAFIDVMAETKTIEDEKDFIKMKLYGYADGTDYLFFILQGQRFAAVSIFIILTPKLGKAKSVTGCTPLLPNAESFQKALKPFVI